MRIPKRKRHWQRDVLSAFDHALKRFDSGATGTDDIEDLYKLGAAIAAENRGIEDPATIKQMAEFAEELVKHDHDLEPDNKIEVLFHFVSAYLYAHVPAGILEELEADRIMEYLVETVGLFIEPELEPSDLPFGDDTFKYPLDIETPGYDPSIAPDKGEWLALDESEQINIVADFHESHGRYGDSLEVHAAVHATIETQIANDTPEVTAALDRFIKQGLTRHDAIHAIGFVFFETLQELLQSDDSDAEDQDDRYREKLSRFNVKDWLG